MLHAMRDAIRDAWGAAESITLVASLLALAGINYVVESMPTVVVMALCTIAYFAGYIMGYKRSKMVAKRVRLRQARTADGRIDASDAGLVLITKPVAQSIVDVLESENGSLPLDDSRWAVKRSIDNHDGVFYEVEFMFGGSPTGKKTGDFALTKRWSEYVSDVEVLKAIKEIAERSA